MSCCSQEDSDVFRVRSDAKKSNEFYLWRQSLGLKTKEWRKKETICCTHEKLPPLFGGVNRGEEKTKREVERLLKKKVRRRCPTREELPGLYSWNSDYEHCVSKILIMPEDIFTADELQTSAPKGHRLGGEV
mmetsp:Transcript_5618/g.11127  ORF Transcript_5618/g.11127 Transcript_5618/m.11127 type:complete len:132 (-) Transcript_5618:1585-1980(-)